MNESKKLTPIYEISKRLKAGFVELGGWQVAQNYGDVAAETAVIQTRVAISNQSHNGKIRIEGNKAGTLLQADDLAINAGKEVEYGRIYRLRQDLFFVCTSADGVEETAVSLTQQADDSPDLITVTDMTHGNAELWLVGPKSAELLSRLCGLDFHDSQFPDMTAKQSSVANTAQLIIRRDISAQAAAQPRRDALQTVPVYALVGARSLAAYLWQTIMQAGQDLGIQPIGLAALRQLAAKD